MKKYKYFAWKPKLVYNYKNSTNAYIWLNTYYVSKKNVSGFQILSGYTHSLPREYVVHPNILCINIEK